MKIDLILLSICVIFYQAQAGQYLDGPISLNWISNDQSTTNFSMSSSGMSNGNYFAFGFSKDQQMVWINNNLMNKEEIMHTARSKFFLIPTPFVYLLHGFV